MTGAVTSNTVANPQWGHDMTANPFTADIIGWAMAAQRVYQIPASLNLSAAKLESNLGAATPPGTNNWHGIKDPHNTSTTATKEQRADGSWYTIAAGFRVFASPAESFMYYGQLLGLAAPYHDMVTVFLKSPRGPADVAALSHALTGVYATAKNYGAALVEIQQSFNLYQYDHVPAVVTPPAQPAPPAVPAVKTGGKEGKTMPTTTTTTTTPTSAPAATSTLTSFLQFLQDVPFDKIVDAVNAGGRDIPLDIDLARTLISEITDHFFKGGVANATHAAIAPIISAATAANPSGAIGG